MAFYPAYLSPAFEYQENHLKQLPKASFDTIFEYLNTLKETNYKKGFMNSETGKSLHRTLIQQGIIFSSPWMEWEPGLINIKNTSFDYSDASFLEISMYITAIFNADRSHPGIIERNFQNGTLDKIFRRLKEFMPEK